MSCFRGSRGRQAVQAGTLCSLLLLLAACLAGQQLPRAAAAVATAPTKWTILVYMLADNNLEMYGLWDMEEIMAAMYTEPAGAGKCTTSACGAACPASMSPTWTDGASCSGAAKQTRCCDTSTYPDVLVLVDKGRGMALSQRLFSMPHADYSLLDTQWSSAKLLRALPGGQWEHITEYAELNMASAPAITDFVSYGLARFPPDGARKYALVFWDHGSGWMGFGADATCGSMGAGYSEAYCGIGSMQTVATGVANALAGVKDPLTQAPFKLDVVGFDACLMAMYEVGSLLAPYANFLLASELLEPGTGWDYSQLGYLTLGSLGPAGPAVNAATGFSEAQLAHVVIQGYLASVASGLTMALVDLRLVTGSLVPAMNALANELKTQLQATPALAMTVLQQRTLLGYIDSGGSAAVNVDLGALLARLNATTTGTLKQRASAALAAYRTTVVAFGRDGELADGTGTAIFFPSDADSMESSYTSYAGADAALSAWLAFLQQLFSATSLIFSSGAGFGFEEPYAVPYWSVGSSTWVTHGTLTSVLGLTADLAYGFISPAGTEFISAGSTVGRIAQTAAVGAWSGQLFGLVQDLTLGDGAVDGLALAYASEQRITDDSGSVQQLILLMQAYYASSCYADSSDMQSATLKYVFNIADQTSTLQLFVNSGARGEVPPAQGGVVIPYLGRLDLTGVSPGVGTSLGYSDCLKWGYGGSISVAAFNATQAAGILGLDLTRDLATLLTVRSVSGHGISLYGAFQPAQKTRAGCQCSQLWSYRGASNAVVQVAGQCVNPTGEPLAWCQYEPESCATTPTSVGGAPFTDFCEPTTTLSGCRCHPNWSYRGVSYYGTCATTNDPRGAWCVVDRASCGTARAHEFGPANTTTASINGSSAVLTGLDFDFCQVTTRSGCHCSNSWEYGGVRYNGTCRTGLLGGAAATSVPGISANTSWCFVDKTCTSGRHLDGFSYDVCGPEGGRLTEPSPPSAPAGAPCQLPAVYGGAALYDCISYNHSAPGQRTPRPWCFTDQATGQWRYCAAWRCAAAVQLRCPAWGAGLAAASNLTGWAQPACLQALCDARANLANISTCTQDSPADMAQLAATYSGLTASADFGALLRATTGTSAASLDAYCLATYGQLCVDKVLDPACPALYWQNNVWMASTSVAQLCDTSCLTALCRLQEQSKSDVTGMPGVSGQPSETTCADDELTTQVMWSLLRMMDARCGWSSPTVLACNKLLSPAQQCAADTMIVPGASGTLTDGAPTGGSYSASSVCSWTIASPNLPYISLNFSRFDTERLYDVVTVEDFEGVIGMFSGSLTGADLPMGLTTDTGLLRVNFTADGSLQGAGFGASYAASSTPQVNIPACTSGTKLLQVLLRTRSYGSEMGWLVAKRNILGTVFGTTPTSSNIVMAGGALPRKVRALVSADVLAASDAEYKDYRSYYRYACLPTGDYSLFAFDSYGDGWDAGRITLTQVLNATTGCMLIFGASATPAYYNRTTLFSITADADTSSSACGALTSPGGAYEYVEAGLVLGGEDTNSFTLAKQRKLKESLAILLDVDTAQVVIFNIANATAAQLDEGAASATNGSAAARTGGDAGASSLGSSDATFSPAATRRLQAAAPALSAPTGGASQEEEEETAGSISAVLRHQSSGPQGEHAGSRMQALGKLAISIPELLASGVLDAAERQLQDWSSSKAADGGAAHSRALQQLLTLDSEGAWLNGTAAAAAEPDATSLAVPPGLEGDNATATANSSSGGGNSSAASAPASDIFVSTDDNATSTADAAAAVSDAAASVLAEKPLGPSAGATLASKPPAHSQLVAQLQAHPPSKPVVLQRQSGQRTGSRRPPAQVTLQQSFSEAFGVPASPTTSPRVAAAAAAAAAASYQARFNATLTSSAGASFLPWARRVPAGDASSNGSVQLSFDTVQPGRGLQQYTPGSAGADAAGSTQQLVAGASVDPAAVAEMLQAGRARHTGDRPLGTLRPPGSPARRRTLAASTSHASAGSGGDGWSAPTAAALPLSGPEQRLAASAAHRSSVSAAQRHLLQQQQPAATKGVAVVLRVNGYASAEDAASASGLLSTVVCNGSLTSTLGAQGWPNVTVGLLYVTTGSAGNAWDRASWLMRIIISACAGGVGLLVLIGAVWWVHRRRWAGAAQVPAAQQQQHPAQHRTSAATYAPGRASAAAGLGPPRHPHYLPPQQAAGRLSVAEGAPIFSRGPSPSAPMLTASQQAALAARMGGGSPLQHQQQPMYAPVAPMPMIGQQPGGGRVVHGYVLSPGSSFTGPAAASPPGYPPYYSPAALPSPPPPLHAPPPVYPAGPWQVQQQWQQQQQQQQQEWQQQQQQGWQHR